MSHTKKRTNVGKRTRAKMCTDKAPRTEAEAKAKADERVAQGAFRESINVYPCPWCRHWHVGTRYTDDVRLRRRR